MGNGYSERKQYAIDDIAKHAGQHVIKEEPVRSFRFHGHYTDKKYDKGRVDHRPGFVTFTPVQSVKFAYTSTYCFTLTWTPGHMTIVGDLGELTIVHYHAMPTLEEACSWLLTPDYHYLLSKTQVRQEFDRDQTIDDIWRRMMEGVEEHCAELAKEIKAYEADPPKWRKRDGMTKADFDLEMKYYAEDHPRINYGFRECPTPHRELSRHLWKLSERIGWHVPDSFELLATAWKFFLESYDNSVGEDPNVLLTEHGRMALKKAMDHYFYDRSDEEIQGWVYRDLDYDDYSGVYEYPQRAFFQIAAIQFGCRMVQENLFGRREAA